MSRKPAAKSGKTGWRVCAIILCAALCTPLVPSQSFAQEQRRTLFEMLFGRPVGREDAPSREYQPRNRRDFPSAPRERAVTRPQPARKAPSVVQMRTIKPEPAAKLENARRVLVVGDFLAGGMGRNWSTPLPVHRQSPSMRANGSSGLVRTDYYDWFANLPQFITETNPATIVIMMGSNDRQQMQIGDIREKFGTDVWFKEYERRIDELLTIAGRKKVPLLWVGLPAFQSPSLTADLVGFNRLYRSHVEKYGGEFVDVWDGFVDEAGKFVITGYDMNGQQARLREADGVGMTSAGKRKLAFTSRNSCAGTSTAPALISRKLTAATCQRLLRCRRLASTRDRCARNRSALPIRRLTAATSCLAIPGDSRTDTRIGGGITTRAADQTRRDGRCAGRPHR